jgi:hypothetical protein
MVAHRLNQPTFVTFRLDDTLPRCLDQAPVAQFVHEAILRGESLNHYDLHAWAITANEVQMLITPHIPVVRLVATLKSASAARANALLSRTGRHFWDDDCLDEPVRDSEEFDRVKHSLERSSLQFALS